MAFVDLVVSVSSIVPVVTKLIALLNSLSFGISPRAVFFFPFSGGLIGNEFFENLTPVSI